MPGITYAERYRNIEPYMQWYTPPRVNASFASTVYHAFSEYSPISPTNFKGILNTISYLLDPTESEFDPFANLPEGYEEWASAFWKARNANEIAEISRQIDTHLRNQQVMDKAGFIKSLPGTLLAGISDPILLAIPGSAIFKTLKGGTAALTFWKTFGRTAAMGAAANVPTELMLQMGNPIRTWQESTLDTVAAGLLTGVLGGIASGLSHGVTHDAREVAELLMLPPPAKGKYTADMGEMRYSGELVSEGESLQRISERLFHRTDVDQEVLRSAVWRRIAKEYMPVPYKPPKGGPVIRYVNDLFNEWISNAKKALAHQEFEIVSKTESLQRLIPRWMSMLADDNELLRKAAYEHISGRYMPVPYESPLPPGRLNGAIEEIRNRFDRWIEEAEKRLAPWKTVLSFPGELVSKEDARILGRLIPWDEPGRVPVIFSENLSEQITGGLQNAALNEIRILEKEIDGLVEEFQKAATDAYYAATKRARAGALKRAKNRGAKILEREAAIENKLREIRDLVEQDAIDYVKIERGGHEYYIPRHLIETDYKIVDIDGVHSPLDTPAPVAPLTVKPSIMPVEEIAAQQGIGYGRIKGAEVFDAENGAKAIQYNNGVVLFIKRGSGEPDMHVTVIENGESLGLSIDDIASEGFIYDGKYLTREEASSRMRAKSDVEILEHKISGVQGNINIREDLIQEKIARGEPIPEGWEEKIEGWKKEVSALEKQLERVKGKEVEGKTARPPGAEGVTEPSPESPETAPAKKPETPAKMAKKGKPAKTAKTPASAKKPTKDIETLFWAEHKRLDEGNLQDRAVSIPKLWKEMEKEGVSREEFEAMLFDLAKRRYVLLEKGDSGSATAKTFEGALEVMTGVGEEATKDYKNIVRRIKDWKDIAKK